MSKDKEVKFDPRNPNANIHGMVGTDGHTTCLTADGRRCTGCCTALEIRESSAKLSPKSAGDDCAEQLHGQGCRLVMQDLGKMRYPVCPKYHCCHDISQARRGDLAAKQRIVMENAAALMNEEISRETNNRNLSRI